MYKMKSDIKFSLTHEMLENAENERIHTSYAQEKAILECVSNGDIHALENTYYSLPTTVYGKMTSSNSKLKLLFYASIANTTLVTRYAIEGGLNEETAFLVILTDNTPRIFSSSTTTGLFIDLLSSSSKGNSTNHTSPLFTI